MALLVALALAQPLAAAPHPPEAPDSPGLIAVPDLTRPETPADAERCLATAIYYESAREPAEGKAAVAQVVLNRTRHPAYPKSVCGVVWQGHTRTTGCQFSFTCDGALARAPDPKLWADSVAAAQQALAGGAAPGLEAATNYHADYVRPYWKPSLTQVAAIGRHVFYRQPGASRIAATPAFGGVAVSQAPAPAPERFTLWGLDPNRIAAR